MSDTALTTIDASTGEVIAPLTVRELPADTLAAAHRAAAALQDVISKKKHPVIFQGEQYLEYEDWQTVGRFYGVTAKTVSVEPVLLAELRGFKAVAVAHSVEGRELSRAEAYCVTDEKQWQGKPLFMLASMAQTRACAKSLRNVLSWVVVLAGYRGTPAEELPREERDPPRTPPIRPSPTKAPGCISLAQQKRFFAIAKEHGWEDLQLLARLEQEGCTRSSEIPVARYDAIIADLQLGPPEAPAEGDTDHPF